MPKLRITDQHDSNRLKCPRGHSAIGPTNNHWHCVTCARHWDDVDPEFWEVVDGKTGETYKRDEVELDFALSGVNPA